MPRHGILLLRRMGAVGEDVRRSAFGVSAAFGVRRRSALLAILCVGDNQGLKMEMTKKEVRGESKEVKRPEIDSAKKPLFLYTRTPLDF
jgi:hypothetical protein